MDGVVRAEKNLSLARERLALAKTLKARKSRKMIKICEEDFTAYLSSKKNAPEPKSKENVARNFQDLKLGEGASNLSLHK